MDDAINFYEKQLKEFAQLIQDAIEQDQETRQQSEQQQTHLVRVV